jgi:hypothetical protein
MLEEIGDNLPRFLLYQRLLSTSRMSQVVSKLYAAMIEFLQLHDRLLPPTQNPKVLPHVVGSIRHQVQGDHGEDPAPPSLC